MRVFLAWLVWVKGKVNECCFYGSFSVALLVPRVSITLAYKPHRTLRVSGTNKENKRGPCNLSCEHSWPNSCSPPWDILNFSCPVGELLKGLELWCTRIAHEHVCGADSQTESHIRGGSRNVRVRSLFPHLQRGSDTLIFFLTEKLMIWPNS